MHSAVRTMVLCLLCAAPVTGSEYRFLLDVPDYDWHAGCFGTACGNLMGFWDRHGFPDFYTGPTGGGVAPLDSYSGATIGIRSMWASQAGFDGRPADKPGHLDDYWDHYYNTANMSYESEIPDRYQLQNRPEHAPDCIGDFIGLSQRKWKNQNGECDGNIDAFSFVFWDKAGHARTNYYPRNTNGVWINDIPSGLKEWTKSRGYDADAISQLTAFNPTRTSTDGFTFEQLKAEINAGYPVLVYLQSYYQYSRTFGSTNGNPDIHGMLIYGYLDDESSGQWAVVQTSWGDSRGTIRSWAATDWVGFAEVPLPPRGVIVYHPKPKIRRFTRTGTTVSLTWDGPTAQIYDQFTGQAKSLHYYQVQQSDSLTGNFTPVGSPTTDQSATIDACCGGTAFFRVVLVPPPASP